MNRELLDNFARMVLTVRSLEDTLSRNQDKPMPPEGWQRLYTLKECVRELYEHFSITLEEEQNHVGASGSEIST